MGGMRPARRLSSRDFTALNAWGDVPTCVGCNLGHHAVINPFDGQGWIPVDLQFRITFLNAFDGHWATLSKNKHIVVIYIKCKSQSSRITRSKNL